MWERGVQRSPSLHPPLPSLVVSGVPGLGLSLPQVEVYRQPSRRWEEGGGGVASLLARVKPHRGEGVRVHRSESLFLPLKGKGRQPLPLASSGNQEAGWGRGEGGRVRNMQVPCSVHPEHCERGTRREKLRRAKSLPSSKQRVRGGRVGLGILTTEI